MIEKENKLFPAGNKIPLFIFVLLWSFLSINMIWGNVYLFDKVSLEVDGSLYPDVLGSPDIKLLSENDNYKLNTEGQLSVELEERGWSSQLFDKSESRQSKITAKVFVDYTGSGPARWSGLCVKARAAVSYNRRFYLFVLDASDGEMRLEQYKGDYKNRMILGKKPSNIKSSGWHILSLEVKDARLKAGLDNTIVFDINCPSNEKGYMGLYQMLGTGASSQEMTQMQEQLRSAQKDISGNAQYRLALLEGQPLTKASPVEKFDGVISALENVQKILPGSLTARKAALKAAYFKYDREGAASDNAGDVFEKRKQGFLSVSASYPGTLEASEALFRVGMLYRGKGSSFKNEAIRYFEDAVKTSPGNDTIKAIAQTNLAAMILEKAYDNTASFDQAIGESLKVLDIEGATGEEKATANLMMAEAMYFNKDYSKSLTMADEVVRKYPLQRHQAMMAQFYMGMNLFAQEKREEAIAAFLKVQENYDEEDNWPHNNVKAWSLKYMSQIYLNLQNYSEAKKVLEKLTNTYPDTSYGIEAASLLRNM